MLWFEAEKWAIALGLIALCGHLAWTVVQESKRLRGRGR